jgi:hypothetical protein
MTIWSVPLALTLTPASTSSQALRLTRRPSSPASSSSSSPSSRVRGRVQTSRPPTTRRPAAASAHWPSSSSDTPRQPPPNRARGSLQPRPTGRHVPAARAHRPYFVSHRQGHRLRAEPDPNRAQRCLDQERNPNPNPDNPDPKPEPQPCLTLTRHPDQELVHLHPGHLPQHRLLPARASRALPQLRLLRLGHLPEPPPQRGRRGWRGGIVHCLEYVSGTPSVLLVCGGGGVRGASAVRRSR